MNIQKIITLSLLSLFSCYQLKCVNHENPFAQWLNEEQLENLGEEGQIIAVNAAVTAHFLNFRRAHLSHLNELMITKTLDTKNFTSNFINANQLLENMDLLSPTFRKNNVELLLEAKCEIKRIIEFIVNDARCKQIIDIKKSVF